MSLVNRKKSVETSGPNFFLGPSSDSNPDRPTQSNQPGSLNTHQRPSGDGLLSKSSQFSSKGSNSMRSNNGNSSSAATSLDNSDNSTTTSSTTSGSIGEEELVFNLLDESIKEKLLSPTASEEALFKKSFWFLFYEDERVEDAFLVYSVRTISPLMISGVLGGIAMFVGAWVCQFLQRGHWTGPWMLFQGTIQTAIGVTAGFQWKNIELVSGSTPQSSTAESEAGHDPMSRTVTGQGAGKEAWSSSQSPLLLDLPSDRHQQQFFDGDRARLTSHDNAASTREPSSDLYTKRLEAVKKYEIMGHLYMTVALFFTAVQAYPQRIVCMEKFSEALGVNATTSSTTAISHSDDLFWICLGYIYPHTIFLQSLPVLGDSPRVNLYLWETLLCPLVLMFLGRGLLSDADIFQGETLGDVFALAVVQMFLVPALLGCVFRYVAETRRKIFETFIRSRRLTKLMSDQQNAIDQTLHVVLPPNTMEQLRQGITPIDMADSCSVVICCIHDFKNWATSMMPAFATKALDSIIALFDQKCSSEFGCRKVKNIGDMYFLTHGLGTAAENGKLYHVEEEDSNQSSSGETATTSSTAAGGTTAVKGKKKKKQYYSYSSVNALLCARWMIRMGKRYSQAELFPSSSDTSDGQGRLELKAAVHSGWMIGGLIGDGKRSLWYEVCGEALDGALAILATVKPLEARASSEALSHTRGKFVGNDQRVAFCTSSSSSSPFSSGRGGGGGVREESRVLGTFLYSRRTGPNDSPAQTGTATLGRQVSTEVVGNLSTSHNSKMAANSANVAMALSGSGNNVFNSSTGSGQQGRKERHAFLRRKILDKNPEEEGFFGHSAVKTVLSQQKHLRRGGFFNLYLRFGSVAMEEQYQQACQVNKNDTLVGLTAALVPFSCFLIVTNVLQVATLWSNCLCLANLGSIWFLTRLMKRPENRQKKLAPSVDLAIYICGYASAFIMFWLIEKCILNTNLGYVGCLMTLHVSMVLNRHPWYVYGLMYLAIYAAVNVTEYLVTQRVALDNQLAFPLIVIGLTCNAWGTEWRRRKYFRDKVAITTMKEAAENELQIFRQLLQLLVPQSVVDIVVAKAANRRSPCIDSLGEVCLAALEICSTTKLSALDGADKTNLGNSYSNLLGGSTSLPNFSNTDDLPAGSSSLLMAPPSDSSMTSASFRGPLDHFKRVESFFVSVEEELAKSQEAWLRLSGAQLPLIERIYTVGDRLLIAGPLKEETKPKLPMKSTAPMKPRSELIAVVSQQMRPQLVVADSGGDSSSSCVQWRKEDILHQACLSLCALVSRIQERFDDGRLEVFTSSEGTSEKLSLKAVLHTGPGHAAIVGVARPSFSLLGTALDTVEKLLDAAPAGYLGGSEKFWQLFRHGFDVASRAFDSKILVASDGAEFTSGILYEDNSTVSGAGEDRQVASSQISGGTEFSTGWRGSRGRRKDKGSKTVDSLCNSSSVSTTAIPKADTAHRGKANSSAARSDQPSPQSNATSSFPEIMSAVHQEFSAQDRWKVKGLGLMSMRKLNKLTKAE